MFGKWGAARNREKCRTDSHLFSRLRSITSVRKLNSTCNLRAAVPSRTGRERATCENDGLRFGRRAQIQSSVAAVQQAPLPVTWGFPLTGFSAPGKVAELMSLRYSGNYDRLRSGNHGKACRMVDRELCPALNLVGNRIRP
jgi:hypothetical protein